MKRFITPVKWLDFYMKPESMEYLPFDTTCENIRTNTVYYVGDN